MLQENDIRFEVNIRLPLIRRGISGPESRVAFQWWSLHGSFSSHYGAGSAACRQRLFHPKYIAQGPGLQNSSSTKYSFSGLWGPQGMAVIENLMEDIAAKLRRDPYRIRTQNCYGDSPRDLTPYGQKSRAGCLKF